MMKTLLCLSIVVLVVMAGPMVYSQKRPFPERPQFALPPQAVEIAPGVLDLGTALDVSGRLVQGYAFVHPKRGNTHRPKHDGGGGPGGGGGKKGGGGDSQCFALFSKGARWKSTEPYVLNPANNDVADWFIESVTQTSLDTWDDQVGFDLFESRDTSNAVNGADTESPDGHNEIYFGNIGDPGVIAVTIVWGIFFGPPPGRELVEWDAVFDDEYFFWGDALGAPGTMDYQNIATHEFGHAAGLDHPDSTCTDETMYAFAEEGETKKRTLNAGDIGGINEIY